MSGYRKRPHGKENRGPKAKKAFSVKEPPLPASDGKEFGENIAKNNQKIAFCQEWLKELPLYTYRAPGPTLHSYPDLEFFSSGMVEACDKATAIFHDAIRSDLELRILKARDNNESLMQARRRKEEFDAGLADLNNRDLRGQDKMELLKQLLKDTSRQELDEIIKQNTSPPT